MRHAVHIIVVFVCMTIVSGCATTTRNTQEKVASLYTQGQYEEASKSIENKSHKMPMVLDGANVMFMAGKYEQAVSLLDEAELACKDDDTEHTLVAAGKFIGEALFNREFMDYEPRTCDRVLINTYKGLAQMALLDQQRARVEFNRAYDRQRRAVEEFAKEIAAEQERLAEEQKTATPKERPSDLDFARTKESCAALVQDNMPEMKEWQAYPDFVNPYTTYLAGLFFALNGEMASDFSKASTLLRRVDAMVPRNKTVQHDTAMALRFEKGKSTPATERPTVWVIFENGLAPSLTELRIDLPIFALRLDSPVKNVPFVLPRVQERSAAYAHLVVRSGKNTAKTQEVASIDRVVQTEYKARFPMLLTRALVGTATKAFAQYLAEETGGSGAALVMTLFTTVSARADLRSWDALPKNIHVARLPMPKDRILYLDSPDGGAVASVSLPDTRFALVHVRIPTHGVPAALSVIPMGTSMSDTEVAKQ